MTVPPAVARYHETTRHDFHAFARSSGFLDWATQPDPFRTWRDAPVVRLAFRSDSPAVSWDDVLHRRVPHQEPTAERLGDFLRHALGLAAWKRHGAARWSLRVNPSSGNLHPTEGWLVLPPARGWSDRAACWHYRSDLHALEARVRFDPAALADLLEPAPPGAFLVALSSVPWRESWKYGERAFRYCQHDVGHALAALSFAAALFGWRVTVQPRWPHEAVASLLGLDREGDVHPAEREVPELVAAVSAADAPPPDLPPCEALLAAVRAGDWSGPAGRLSPDHVRWEVVEAAAAATPATGRAPLGGPADVATVLHPARGVDARALVRQRRSCVAVDPTGRALPRADFFRLLAALAPKARAPWDALDGPPAVHPVLFVHRVAGVASGLYVLPRGPSAADRLRPALRAPFPWEPVEDAPPDLPLFRLAAGDCRDLAARLSCGQDIAGDGCFAVAMIAELGAACEARGAHAWRELHWEAGALGQVLYLEAEAAGFRGTGIGCYFDEPTHRALGVAPGLVLADLYHFTVGTPVEDPRLHAEPPYPAEVAA